jgi:hypothetical protein
MHRWSFDNFAPDDCADIEIDAAVIDGMVVVRFVVLRRVWGSRRPAPGRLPRYAA